MMLPAEDYWALEGMDEGYFLHVEDVDFCHRFRAAGGEIYFVSQVTVTHMLSTSETALLFIEWHKTRGFIRYFRKNFAGVYPPMFLFLVNAGVLARFALKASKILAHGLFHALAVRGSPPPPLVPSPQGTPSPTPPPTRRLQSTSSTRRCTPQDL
jgi:GT2 family glycosyltransferase